MTWTIRCCSSSMVFRPDAWCGCLLGIALLALLTTSTMSFAQNNSPEVHVTPRMEPVAEPEQESNSSLKMHTKPFGVRVDLVLVPVIVTDSMQRLVLGLDKNNFQVYENKELQSIQHFSSEDAPISLGVIFDTSGSMASGSKVERAREAVVEFLRTANPQDEAFMITFADKPELTAGFTSSVEDIQGKLVYTTPKGRTALLDAIYLGISEMRQAKYTKKALLIISDGGDNHSRYSEGEIKNLVKEADVQIYAIGIYDHYFATEEERLGPLLLSEVSELTGGRAITIDNPNDMPDVASKIAIELRNQYVIGYQPKARVRDGKWHRIKVKLLPPKGLPPVHLFAKQGYYAPSE